MDSQEFRQILANDLKSTSNRFQIRPDDGLLISAIKCLGGPYQCWHRLLMNRLIPALSGLMERFVLPGLSTMAPLLGVAKNRAEARKFTTAFRGDAQSRRNAALDLYIFLRTSNVRPKRGISRGRSKERCKGRVQHCVEIGRRLETRL